MTLSQAQFDALAAYIRAAVSLAASYETSCGGGHRENVAFEEAHAAAQAALVEPTP